jgi:hypothetical protein
MLRVLYLTSKKVAMFPAFCNKKLITTRALIKNN